MYSIAKKFLFCFNPELAHHLTLFMLDIAKALGILPLFAKPMVNKGVSIMGIDFPNRVGLAAGMDKDADHFEALGKLGFGFIEVGTVTPVPQAGNPKTRLFRLVSDNAVINRMGFNNKGIAYLAANVKQHKYPGVLGINIGKNKVTAEEDALSDYEKCMDAIYDYADYIAVNVSSPNTPGLRNLQFGETFDALLKGIKAKQAQLAEHYGKYVPVAVKIAPDMTDEALKSIAESLLAYKVDGVIATNTTISREGIEGSIYKDETGGLSGKPLTKKSTEVIKKLSSYLNGAIPIIGVGGIMTAADAAEKIAAGASVVQLYSGFIFAGPDLIADAAEAAAAA